ncbi:MAG: DUF177 domain-containing protein [Candidatus Eisenbacteria sp.]|nr:DUF177 domain-containing protein [Candidatus Eisenbacteria bacterium]
MDARKPLRLTLRDVPQGESTLSEEFSAGDLDVVEVDFLAPVSVTVELVRSGEQLQVRGAVTTRIRQRCVRCLEEIDTEISMPVEVVARRPTERERGDDPPEGMLFHDGKELSLLQEVRELILLGIPQTPVCRPDCAGLCPHCGENRSSGACRCADRPSGDPRWRALEKLPGSGPQQEGSS